MGKELLCNQQSIQKWLRQMFLPNTISTQSKTVKAVVLQKMIKSTCHDCNIIEIVPTAVKEEHEGSRKPLTTIIVTKCLLMLGIVWSL